MRLYLPTVMIEVWWSLVLVSPRVRCEVLEVTAHAKYSHYYGAAKQYIDYVLSELSL
jgi:hypothetical protein